MNVMFIGGLPGGPELIVIIGIIVLLFGANKIPKIARSVGKAGGEFKRGREEIEEELEEDESETDTEENNKGGEL